MERFDFVNRANAEYIDRLYDQYLRDPQSLDETWQAYFSGFEFAGGRNLRLAPPEPPPGMVPSAAAPAREELSGNASIGIFDLVHSYRELGHFIADLDPLG